MSDPKKAVGRARGGVARAEALSADERKAIAKKAAQARWESSLPKATFGSAEKPLRIGAWEIPCYVLEDGRRVLVQRGMMSALDMSQGTAGRGGGDRLAKFVSTKALSSFVSNELAEVIKNPIVFQTPNASKAYGYEATVLADLCDAVLEARKSGSLHYQQEHIAVRCEMLVRAFAKVGIIALVDEATGYQQIRDRDALSAILDKYLRKELAAWAKRFPDEFYKEMFRLKGWPMNPLKVKRPGVVGKYTNNIVYERLAPGILDELEKRNPKDERGNRKGKHHQLLTEDVGHPALAQHLYAVIGFMRVSKTWESFLDLLDRAYPRKFHTLELDLSQE